MSAPNLAPITATDSLTQALKANIIPNQEYLLQGSVLDSAVEVLLHRLRGLCDNVDAGPETFDDQEVCFSLRDPNQQAAPLMLRVRKALDARDMPFQLRYIGQPDLGDKNRPTIIRSSLDIACSGMLIEFLNELGCRIEFEYSVKGYMFRKGRMKITVAKVFKVSQSSMPPEPISQSYLVELSRAVMAVKSTIFMPIFPWILQCGVLAYGVAVGMHLVSIGESTFSVVNLENDTSCVCPEYKDYDKCDPVEFLAKCSDCKDALCHFAGLDSPNTVIVLHIANLLGLFWALFFISGVADMVLASTFSTWYWTFHKRDVPFFTLFSGLSRTFCYHLGTVALGSLIIAIVRVIRVILEYIDNKLKKFDNPFTRCVLCCCKCFCWCLENFLKFINKNAYIMCAVHGKNFCTSARDAFSLLLRNVVRVVVLDKVMDFIFFLSKMLISIGIGIAVYYLLQWKFVYDVTQGERLNYNYVPAVALGIAAYIVSTIFFNVYSMAVDTLFLCFLEDCERNDGSAEKPYFMSKSLMKILGKHNDKNKRE